MIKTCPCKNIQIKGEMTLQFMESNVSPIEKSRLRIRKTIFLIHDHSFEFQDVKRVKANLLEKQCLLIKCLTCGTTFWFFTLQKQSYMKKIEILNVYDTCSCCCPGKENEHKKLQQCCHHDFSSGVVDSKFDRNKENYEKVVINNDIFDDDYDMNFMFSNDDVPFVGSYNYNEFNLQTKQFELEK